MKSEYTGMYSSYFHLGQRDIQLIVEGLRLLIIKELKGKKKIEHTRKSFQASQIKDAFETVLDSMLEKQIEFAKEKVNYKENIDEKI